MIRLVTLQAILNRMLKSCTYCGRIHDAQYICPAKAEKKAQYPKDSRAAHTRSLSRWQKTRDWIKQRDNGVCQLCIRNYPGTIRPYEGEGLSVHHITKLEEDADRAFDELNLITLCRIHHEMVESRQGEGEEARKTRKLLFEIARENSERAAGSP